MERRDKKEREENKDKPPSHQIDISNYATNDATEEKHIAHIMRTRLPYEWLWAWP